MLVKVIEMPAADAKVGLKIDYLAKRLGQVLQPFGFKRKGRTLVREAGEAEQRHWCIVDLQAGQWNEGSRGEFYVNLSVQFPAIERIHAQREGQAWRLEHIDSPNGASGQLRERLESLLHEASPEHPLAGSGIKIRAGTDLSVLGQALEQAMLDTGWPWLQAHSTLQAVRDHAGDIPVRIAAALALGDGAAANALVERHHERWENFDARNLAGLRAWLTAHGVDAVSLPREPKPRPPSAYDLRQQIEEQAEDQTHAVLATALLARADADASDLSALAVAWLTERRARWRAEPAPLKDLPSGQRVAALAEPDRERVLLALLAHLVQAESRAERHPIHIDIKAFELDESVQPVLKALLTTLGNPSESTCVAVVQAMTSLVSRLKQELITACYPWGFAALVRWLIAAGSPHRRALAPAVDDWLQAFSAGIVEHHESTEAALAIENAKPLDPHSAIYDILLEQRQRAAELAALTPPGDVQRRLREYPEQSLAAEDKQAVAAWRQWLRRDPASGALPVRLEPDDWGSAWNSAWAEAPAALQAAAAPIVQGWLEGVETKPTVRWLRGLKAQIAGFDAAQAGAWRDWLLQRLHAFEHSSGQTEWATTGARPGVGARLGDGSQAVLLGLLWWSALDAAIVRQDHDARSPSTSSVEAPVRAAAWRSVADAAWLHLKTVGARSPTVGTLALRLLAGLGGASRDYVTALGSVDKKVTLSTKLSKQVIKAAERALADPVVP